MGIICKEHIHIVKHSARNFETSRNILKKYKYKHFIILASFLFMIQND